MKKPGSPRLGGRPNERGTRQTIRRVRGRAAPSEAVARVRHLQVPPGIREAALHDRHPASHRLRHDPHGTRLQLRSGRGDSQVQEDGRGRGLLSLLLRRQRAAEREVHGEDEEGPRPRDAPERVREALSGSDLGRRGGLQGPLDEARLLLRLGRDVHHDQPLGQRAEPEVVPRPARAGPDLQEEHAHALVPRVQNRRRPGRNRGPRA